jgi:hypothetical protein
VPSQPSLLDFDTPNRRVPALVQSTKRADIYSAEIKPLRQNMRSLSDQMAEGRTQNRPDVL